LSTVAVAMRQEERRRWPPPGAPAARRNQQRSMASITPQHRTGMQQPAGRDTACWRDQAGALKRLKVAGGHWRPIAQQAASPAFEIPLAVPAHIADPAMAANVAPHPFAGTAHAPGAADALVFHQDLPRPDTTSMLRPRKTMSSGMPPVGRRRLADHPKAPRPGRTRQPLAAVNRGD
jgi:hypothetical protein